EPGRHVGDRQRRLRGGAPSPPRGGAGADHVERGDRFVVEAQELRVSGGVLEPLRLDQMQQQHRVVIGESPQRIIQIAEHFARRCVPAPPQIVGKLVQADDAGGKRRKGDVPIHAAHLNAATCMSFGTAGRRPAYSSSEESGMTRSTRTRLLPALVLTLIGAFASAGCDIVTADLRAEQTAQWQKTYPLDASGRVEI